MNHNRKKGKWKILFVKEPQELSHGTNFSPKLLHVLNATILYCKEYIKSKYNGHVLRSELRFYKTLNPMIYPTTLSSSTIYHILKPLFSINQIVSSFNNVIIHKVYNAYWQYPILFANNTISYHLTFLRVYKVHQSLYLWFCLILIFVGVKVGYSLVFFLNIFGMMETEKH